jgi:Ser/Thr protein kinase RdoA (MazF antagonist)
MDPSLPIPRVVPTLAGEETTRVRSEAGEDLIVYALTYRPGRSLWEVTPTPRLMRPIGTDVARLGAALLSFDHPAPEQALVWDIRGAEAMRQYLPLIADDEGRRLAEAALDRFADHTLPLFAGLRHQVIHNDTNHGNVLVIPDASDPVSGLVDFGDLIHAPLVLDISTAVMELATPDDDPVAMTVAFLEGYTGVTALTAEEVGCIYDAAMTRLAVCIGVYAWRDAYRAEPRFDAAAAVGRFVRQIKRMDDIGRDRASAAFLAASDTG